VKYTANPVEVDAFDITAVFHDPIEPDARTLGVSVALRDHEKLTFISPAMCARYTPVIGDYYVVQSDGYVYINPKEVFERKYRLTKSVTNGHLIT
jgi:hypothetical protein